MPIKIVPKINKPADNTPTPTPSAGSAPTTTTTASTPVALKPGDPGFIGPVSPAKTTPPAANVAHYGPTAAELRATRGMTGFIGDSTAYGTPGYQYCLGGVEDMYTHSQHLHDYEKSVFYRAGTAREMYNQVLKHKNINMGAPGVGDMAFFEGGDSGHAALGVGGGYVISNAIDGKYQKILYSDLEKKWGSSGKYLGYTVPTGLYGGKETDPASALKKELGSAYKLPGETTGSGTATGSGTTGTDTTAVQPASPTPTPNPKPTPPPSNSGSSFSNPFGSIFTSMFGNTSNTQNRTVAQGPSSASSSITPGMSSQFDSYTPSSTNESSTSGSSADTLANAEPNSDVTVKPVGS